MSDTSLTPRRHLFSFVSSALVRQRHNAFHSQWGNRSRCTGKSKWKKKSFVFGRLQYIVIMALHFNFVGIDWLTCTPSYITSPTHEQWRQCQRQPKSDTFVTEAAELEQKRKTERKCQRRHHVNRISKNRNLPSTTTPSTMQWVNGGKCDEVWPGSGSIGHSRTCRTTSDVRMKRENCVRVNYKMRIDFVRCERRRPHQVLFHTQTHAYQGNVISIKWNFQSAPRPTRSGTWQCQMHFFLLLIEMSSSQAHANFPRQLSSSRLRFRKQNSSELK